MTHNMTLVYPIIEESGEVHTPQSDYLIIAELGGG